MPTSRWTPARLGSAATLWLRADVGITLAGSDITAAADSSPNAKNFTTTGTPPTFSATGGPSGGPHMAFNGSQFLSNASTPGAFITAAAYEIWASVYFTALSLNSTPNNNHVVLGNPSGYVTFAGSVSGMMTAHYDGAVKTATRAGLSAGAWALVRGRFDGVNIYTSINNGAETSQAAGTLTSLVTGNMQLGKGGGALNGRVSEIIVTNSSPSTEVAASLVAYFKRRGLPV